MSAGINELSDLRRLRKGSEDTERTQLTHSPVTHDVERKDDRLLRDRDQHGGDRHVSHVRSGDAVGGEPVVDIDGRAPASVSREVGRFVADTDASTRTDDPGAVSTHDTGGGTIQA